MLVKCIVLSSPLIKKQNFPVQEILSPHKYSTICYFKRQGLIPAGSVNLPSEIMRVRKYICAIKKHTFLTEMYSRSHHYQIYDSKPDSIAGGFYPYSPAADIIIFYIQPNFTKSIFLVFIKHVIINPLITCRKKIIAI